jgi:hypothetical protein
MVNEPRAKNCFRIIDELVIMGSAIKLKLGSDSIEFSFVKMETRVNRKFDEFENAMNTHFGKVDPLLIIDMILRQKKERQKSAVSTLFL